MAKKTRTQPTLSLFDTDELIDAVEALLDVAVTRHPDRSGDVYEECHMCGDWEGHTADCPVPVLKAWQDAK